jgi:hypothetical protein
MKHLLSISSGKIAFLWLFLLPFISGCKKQETDRIILNGTWKLSLNLLSGFENNDMNVEGWRDIQVPGECQMQGFAIKHDKPFIYKKEFDVPAHFINQDIFLCFDGVYSYARVWVNGTYIRDHTGGFTPWECDITALVRPGEKAWITVECTDKKNDQSFASGYAKHQIGGILRDVYVKALSHARINTCHVETILDADYKDAVLAVDLSLQFEGNAELTVTLFDPKGNRIKLPDSKVTLAPTDENRILKYPVVNPLKWDAEHPNLYTLKHTLSQNGKVIQNISQKVGFRKIEIAGNELLVNGKPLKLRGACRHDVHPLLGRVATPDYDLLDAQLAKEANMNFIRTSHYPPTKRFADICDSLGIYLEVENAACFVRTHRLPEYDTVRHYGPEFRESLLTQYKEMVQAFRNNPSVIIWSLGNESLYDENFQQGYDYIKSTDLSRPVIFSYPGTVPGGNKCFDIMSMHYPTYNGNADNYELTITRFRNDTMPTLYDEWAHVACYNKPTIQNDINIREFWGRSLDSMWINSFAAKGSLGGAIWGMIDETFMMPDTMAGYDDWWGINPKGSPIRYESKNIGYGEWGFVDVWRRKKPEFWSVKKAYSPIRILATEVKQAVSNKPIELAVFNRYDHTNLNETSVKWEYEGLSGTVAGVNLAPRETGLQIIPAQNWKNGSDLKVSFLNADDQLIDIYNIKIGETIKQIAVVQERKDNPIDMVETAGMLSVSGKDFTVQFDAKTGLIQAGIYRGDTLIKSGPFLQYTLGGDNLAFTTKKMETLNLVWKLSSLTGKIDNGCAKIEIKGSYNNSFPVAYHLTIQENGEISTAYSFEKPTKKELFELGANYQLAASFDKLIWNRKSYWSVYPDGHMGRPSGEEPLRNTVEEKYREIPEKDWAYDVCSFYYKGMDNPRYKYHFPNIVTALKENIYRYTLVNSLSGNALSVVSNGSVGCRVYQNDPGKIILVINNLWDYPDLLWGNYMKLIRVPDKYANEVTLEFSTDEVHNP